MFGDLHCYSNAEDDCNRISPDATPACKWAMRRDYNHLERVICPTPLEDLRRFCDIYYSLLASNSFLLLPLFSFDNRQTLIAFSILK